MPLARYGVLAILAAVVIPGFGCTKTAKFVSTEYQPEWFLGWPEEGRQRSDGAFLSVKNIPPDVLAKTRGLSVTPVMEVSQDHLLQCRKDSTVLVEQQIGNTTYFAVLSKEHLAYGPPPWPWREVIQRYKVKPPAATRPSPTR